MIKRVRTVLLAASLLVPGLSTASEGDWGYAQINALNVKLNQEWSVFSNSQITLRDDFSEFYFWFIDAGVAYAFNPAWRVGVAYRHAEATSGSAWVEEHRPLVNLDWFGKIKEIKLNNRARLEYRDYRFDKENDMRFRNRTRVHFPWEVLPGGIKPFVEEEFFVGKNSGELEMNWLMSGLYWKGPKTVTLKAGYRWIAVRVAGDWENRNQLVTQLNLSF